MNYSKQVGPYVFDCRQVIGRGSYATVYLAVNQENGQLVATKVIDQRMVQLQSIQQLTNEIETMRSLKNENVVRLLDVYQTANNIYIMSEYCDGGDLRDIIKNGPQPQEKVYTILKHILNGYINNKKIIIISVQELFKNKITHRDLKPANILIKLGVFKIADFGFARQVIDGDLITSIAGTPLYMAPQVLMGQPYTTKCDVWSLGLIAYELFFGRLPFSANNIVELTQQINIPIEIPKDTPEQLKQFLLGCLQVNEHERLGWEQVFNHEIFSRHQPLSDYNFNINSSNIQQIISEQRNSNQKQNQSEIQWLSKQEWNSSCKQNLVEIQSNSSAQQENKIHKKQPSVSAFKENQEEPIQEEELPKDELKIIQQKKMIQKYLEQQNKENYFQTIRYFRFIRYLFNFSIFIEKFIDPQNSLESIGIFNYVLQKLIIQKIYQLELILQNKGDNWLGLIEITTYCQCQQAQNALEEVLNLGKIVRQRFQIKTEDIDLRDVNERFNQISAWTQQFRNQLLQIITSSLKHEYLVLFMMFLQINVWMNNPSFYLEDIQFVSQYPEKELIAKINILLSY